jgi:hypothetical protein
MSETDFAFVSNGGMTRQKMLYMPVLEQFALPGGGA